MGRTEFMADQIIKRIEAELTELRAVYDRVNDHNCVQDQIEIARKIARLELELKNTNDFKAYLAKEKENEPDHE